MENVCASPMATSFIHFDTIQPDTHDEIEFVLKAHVTCKGGSYLQNKLRLNKYQVGSNSPFSSALWKQDKENCVKS